MEKYDYRLAIESDILSWLNENNLELTDENFDELMDRMRKSDQVTGNASGSYTFNIWEAEENICHNWDLIEELCDEWDHEDQFSKGAEYWDVAIRCYLLEPVMREVLEKKMK